MTERKVYDYSEQHPPFIHFKNKAPLHKERTWPTNLSGSMMGRQDERRQCFSPATHRKLACVSKCACFHHLLCAGTLRYTVWRVDVCFYMCMFVRAEPVFWLHCFPHTVLSSIHSVLLNVTPLLASGDDSMLSWLVDLCHLVLALRG